MLISKTCNTNTVLTKKMASTKTQRVENRKKQINKRVQYIFT